MSYLRFKKRCKYCCTETGLFNSDVGASDGKNLWDVECKITYRDFLADFNKKVKHQYYTGSIVEDNKNSSQYIKNKINSKLKHVPNYFIFFVEYEIAEKCLEFLNSKPEYSKYGLATVQKVNQIYSDNVRFLKNPRKLHNSVISASALNYLLNRMGSELCRYGLADRYLLEASSRFDLTFEKYNKILESDIK